MFAQQVLGVDRVLYAMDYPYQFDLQEVGEMERADVSDEVRRKFYQTNAERAFKL
jgi:2,3-dihydroxybenzoate decarboxylase